MANENFYFYLKQEVLRSQTKLTQQPSAVHNTVGKALWKCSLTICQHLSKSKLVKPAYTIG